MPYSPDPVRVALTVVYIIQFFTKNTWAQANTQARQNPDLAKHLPETLTESDQAQGRRVGKKFMKEGTVKNLPHVKKLKTHDLRNRLTDHEYQLAAFILKNGYMQCQDFTSLSGQHVQYQEHTYYTSLGDGLARDAHLKAIYDKAVEFDSTTTHSTFMQALYKCDPLLQAHRVHIKFAMDEALQTRRQKRATSLLTALGKKPMYLERLVHVDECAICFDHTIKRGVQVYCDAHDKGYRFVIPYEGDAKIKVKIMGAVNYATGAVWCEFTTGTTKLNRRHDTAEAPADKVYRVSQRNCHVTCYKR